MAKASSKLQAELKKRSGFESLSQEAWLNLVRTASLLTGRFERFFSQFGLTAGIMVVCLLVDVTLLPALLIRLPTTSKHCSG